MDMSSVRSLASSTLCITGGRSVVCRPAAAPLPDAPALWPCNHTRFHSDDLLNNRPKLSAPQTSLCTLLCNAGSLAYDDILVLAGFERWRCA